MACIQDTGKFRTQILDKFYTNPDSAKECISTLQSLITNYTEYIWIEPSAGSGAFTNLFPEDITSLSMDIAPENASIIKQDYLKWESDKSSKYIVIGNPPFGRQSTLAKKFISKSCDYADIVAFILPRSFVKPSMNRVFPKVFHCIHTKELPKSSFLLNDKPYDVPCVFMIWQKKGVEREDLLLQHTATPIGFIYTKPTETHHICVRRVGVYAGQSYKYGTKMCSPSSHYFIKLDDKYESMIDSIIDKINKVKYEHNTVGPRSISKPEFNHQLNQILVD